MPSCERCWRDSRTADDSVAKYHELLNSRECTPEQQAGPDALVCATCGRKTIHQHVRDWCMACDAERKTKGDKQMMTGTDLEIEEASRAELRDRLASMTKRAEDAEAKLAIEHEANRHDPVRLKLVAAEARAERYREALAIPCHQPDDCDSACKCCQHRWHVGDIAETANETSEWRTCEYCGCRTNARLRQCCDRGHAADGEVALAETANKAESDGIECRLCGGTIPYQHRDGCSLSEPGTSSPDDAERIPGPPDPPRPPRHRPVGYGAVPPPDEDGAAMAACRRAASAWLDECGDSRWCPFEQIEQLAAFLRTRDAQARADERSKAPCPHPLEKIDANCICTRCGVEQPALRERDAQAREAGRVEAIKDVFAGFKAKVKAGYDVPPYVFAELRNALDYLKRPDRAKP